MRVFRRPVLFVSLIGLFTFAEAPAAPKVCSESVMAKLRAPGGGAIRIGCHVALKADDVITKQILLEGPAASGVIFDCGGGRIDVAGDSVLVQSKEITDAQGRRTWQRPVDVTVRNCRIHGAVRVRGMAPNGEGEYLRESSRKDANHTARARASAPLRTLLENLHITGRGRIPLYVAPGSTHVTLRNSKLDGISSSVAIYMDAESGFNVIQNNSIQVQTSREVIAVDASAWNRIIGNRISGLNKGGIYLYRNCGEGGTIRHQTPSYNHIINNVFYYKNYSGPKPSVWVASRNGFSTYCHLDNGFPWGSSVSNLDLARRNVIAENQIYVRDPEEMIRIHAQGNWATRNRRISEKTETRKASSCYLERDQFLLASGKSLLVSRGGHCERIRCIDGHAQAPVPEACR